MAVFTMFHFVDPDLIVLRGAPVSLSSMPFFKASKPRISAPSIALRVVSPVDSNSNSIVALIFIGSLHNLCALSLRFSHPRRPQQFQLFLPSMAGNLAILLAMRRALSSVSTECESPKLWGSGLSWGSGRYLEGICPPAFYHNLTIQLCSRCNRQVEKNGRAETR